MQLYRRALFFIFLILFSLLHAPTVRAETGTCELSINGQNGTDVFISPGQSIQITASNIRLDGVTVQNGFDDSGFYIFAPETNRKKHLPRTAINNGSLSVTLQNDDTGNYMFTSDPGEGAGTGRLYTSPIRIQLIRDHGILPHTLVCTSLSRVTVSQEDCNITGVVTTNPDGTFNLGMSVSTSQLMPGKEYEVALDNGLMRPAIPFSVPAGTSAIQLAALGSFDSGYNGNTYNLYVRYSRWDCVEVAGQACMVGQCRTSVTFRSVAPTLGPDIYPTVPPQPIDPGNPLGPAESIPAPPICDTFPDSNLVKACRRCWEDGTGAWTAIGCIPTSPEGFLSKFLGFGVGIAGGIAFLLILLGGFQVLTSTGNPEHLNAGKELMGAAITGLLLIVFSLFILRLLGYNILGIPGFG